MATTDFGHDDASGCNYSVTFATTEVVDPTAALNGLVLNFRYRCSSHRGQIISRYNLELSGHITDRVHLGDLSALLDNYRVPSAARDGALGRIFDTYGGFGLVEPIQATVDIFVHNYAPFTSTTIERHFLFALGDEERRAMEASAADFLGPKPASREAVEALEKVTIRAEIRETRCAVCLGGFRVGIEVTRMPCSHAFHGDCIHTWLQRRNCCPLCRFELPSAT